MFANKGGLQALLKEGGKSYSGVHEVTLRNIEACKAITNITQTSMGPNSMNKLIINHLGRHFITSDASLILSELDVEHPAVKLIIMASKMQQQEYGDFTNYILIFAGELLAQAEYLIKLGLHTSDIIRGYELAFAKAMPLLKESTCWTVNDVRDPEELAKGIRSTLASKRLGEEAHLSTLVSKAAVSCMPNNPNNFDVDNIRVAKIVGGSLEQSSLVHGMVITTVPNGKIRHKEKCKVLVLSCGLEITGTEAKSTVLLTNSEELINFSKGEEDEIEERIKAIKDSGVDAIVVSGSISEMAQHFCDTFDILTLKVTSKFDLKRICRSLGATALVRLGVPLPEEVGHASSIHVEEIASKKVTTVKAADSKVATILLRGATPNLLDEIERSIDDAINCIKAITRNGRFVAGGGAVEIQLASQLQSYASTVRGLDQYAVDKFAEAFECIPRILADNAGHDSMKVITALYAAHQQGKKYEAVDVTTCKSRTVDALKGGIFDHLNTKVSAMALAVDAVLTVLRIDHIIIARQAGGPNLNAARGDGEEM